MCAVPAGPAPATLNALAPLRLLPHQPRPLLVALVTILACPSHRVIRRSATPLIGRSRGCLDRHLALRLFDADPGPGGGPWRGQHDIPDGVEELDQERRLELCSIGAEGARRLRLC